MCEEIFLYKFVPYEHAQQPLVAQTFYQLEGQSTWQLGYQTDTWGQGHLSHETHNYFSDLKRGLVRILVYKSSWQRVTETDHVPDELYQKTNRVPGNWYYAATTVDESDEKSAFLTALLLFFLHPFVKWWEYNPRRNRL